MKLDIRILKAKGLLSRDCSFSWEWSRDGERTGNVGIVVGAKSVKLAYTITPDDGEPRNVRCLLPITTTPCNYGGVRQWFQCPDCYRRCAVVYGISRAGNFACRVCERLAYITEAMDPVSRCWRAQSKLEAKLTEDGLPPKGMRLRTFERIQDRLDKLEDRKDAHFLPGFYRLAQRFGMSPEDLFK